MGFSSRKNRNYSKIYQSILCGDTTQINLYHFFVSYGMKNVIKCLCKYLFDGVTENE